MLQNVFVHVFHSDTHYSGIQPRPAQPLPEQSWMIYNGSRNAVCAVAGHRRQASWLL
jgi:hypothetical protein